MPSVHIPGACSVPDCPYEPPKDWNPFCHSHWTKVPGRLRKRLGVIWKSRTGGHHGKAIKGPEWERTIAQAVEALGATPRDKLPRPDQPLSPIGAAMMAAQEKLLSVTTMPTQQYGREVMAPDAARAIREINHREEPVQQPPSDTSKPIRRLKLEYQGEANSEVREAYKDFLIERYMADLPKPSPEEIWLAGIKEGVRRAREHMAVPA